MTLKELQSEYGTVKIPEAFRWAVMKRGEAEVLVYQLVTACLERFEDVEIRLDRDDDICKFLRSFQREGFFAGNSLHYQEDESTVTLSCDFDLYGIREDLTTMDDTLFGTISSDLIESYLLCAENIEISEDRMQARADAIQKVKYAGEVASTTDSKKDN